MPKDDCKRGNSVDMKKSNSRPWHLWLVTIIALLFFNIGAFDFINIATQNMDYLTNLYSSLGVEYFTNYPLPLLILFGINIVSGIAGIISALFNKRLAMKLMLVSGTTNFILIFITVIFMDRINVIGIKMTLTDVAVMLGTFGLYFYYKWLSESTD